MQTPRRTLLCALALTVWAVAACEAPDVDHSSSIFQETGTEGVYRVEDESYLAERITAVDEAVEFDDGSDSTLTDRAANGISIRFVGTTSAISINGTKLQATDVAIKSTKAYVSYNQQGDVYAGAVYAMPHIAAHALQVSIALLFASIDINAVAVKGNTLLLAGAADPTQYDVSTPAVLVTVGLVANLPLGSITIVDLPSYAATDIAVHGNTAWITVGADDGGLARVQLNDLGAFDPDLDFMPLEDARSVAVEGDVIAILRGTPGGLYVLDGQTADDAEPLEDLSFEASLVLDGTATQEFAKSTVEVHGDFALMALGDGGMAGAALDGDEIELLFREDQPSVVGLPASKTTTNAASVDDEIAFRANGEAGVEVFDLGEKASKIDPGDDIEPESLGTFQVGLAESANSVLYYKKRLYVAVGLGGMRVLDVD